ncbi:hypothetical protein BT96DRAFT_230460 [Gymnopus androsaceus JB14]|uniref:Uncharacterized protein n=1 Tax=Gymnopus androsaceus JB14 TaxID=1447944 RepID=A0A6A4H4M0_9AGAR|nr:hypothetical protein BT96DRAFT_230460 [Gymnopus androsaceus JB14]
MANEQYPSSFAKSLANHYLRSFAQKANAHYPEPPSYFNRLPRRVRYRIARIFAEAEALVDASASSELAKIVLVQVKHLHIWYIDRLDDSFGARKIPGLQGLTLKIRDDGLSWLPKFIHENPLLEEIHFEAALALYFFPNDLLMPLIDTHKENLNDTLHIDRFTIARANPVVASASGHIF